MISFPHAFAHVSEEEDGDEFRVGNPAQIAGDRNDNGNEDASNSFEQVCTVLLALRNDIIFLEAWIEASHASSKSESNNETNDQLENTEADLLPNGQWFTLRAFGE